MFQIGFIVLSLLIPIILLWQQDQVKLIQWLSPAFWCYAIGIAIGLTTDISPDLIDPIQSGTVALAIPLMLFSANLAAWLRLAKTTLISLLLWIGCVCGMTLVAYHLIGPMLESPVQASAMVSSVYTGGTANMAAVRQAIGAPAQLFNEMNPTDLFISGSYLMLVLTMVPTLLRRWLRPFVPFSDQSEANVASSHQPSSWLDYLIALGLGIVGILIPVGLSMLLFGHLEETFLLIGLTLVGLGGAMIPWVRQQHTTYMLGEYFFLVFCLVMGTQIDLKALLTNAPVLLAFMATVSLGSVGIHTLLAKLFNIDADTALITQVSGMYGPPFIGPVATRLQNKDMVVSGLTLSVILLALGNLIGLAMFSWLNGA